MHQPHIRALIISTAITAVLGGCATEVPKTVEPTQAVTQPQTPVVDANPNVNATRTTLQVPTVARTLPAGRSAYFDYDRDAIKDSSVATVRANADYLAQGSERIELDGNADERGSRDYNMALGQKRADAVKRALTALGVKAERIDTISYGEDKPKAKGHDEASWAENRRVDFVPTNK